MANKALVLYPDPVLNTVCKPVEHFDKNTEKLVTDLTDTLYSTSGIGLSAPQIGSLEQVLVMDLSDNRTELSVYINPVITHKAGLAIVEESCLSLPGVAAKIMRSGLVHVSAQNAKGDSFEKELEGMHAVCLQHELDHLNGKLFIDRLSRLRRFGLRGALQKLKHESETRAIEV